MARPSFREVDQNRTITNLAQLPEQNLKIFGNYIRLVVGQETLELSKLIELSGYFASRLKLFGVGDSDKVAIILPVVQEYHIALPAIWRIGAIAVPIHHTLAPVEMREILKVVKPKVVLTTPEIYKQLAAVELPLENCKIVCSGPAGDIGVASFDSCCEPSQVPAIVNRKSMDPAVIIFTSGTSGRPKGVVQSHFNFLKLIQDIQDTKGVEASLFEHFQKDLVIDLHFTSYAHTSGPFKIISGYYRKSKSILMNKFDVQTVLFNIQNFRVNFFTGSSTALASICSFPEINKFDISSVKCWKSASAPITEENLRKFEKTLGKRIFQAYGLSESVVLFSVEMSNEHRPGSAGKPLSGSRIKIIGEDGAEITGGSNAGELCILRGSNALGYFNDPESQAKTFQGGWVHTGDLAKLDNDGNLYIIGKKSQTINQGGYKIFPSEVQSVIEKLPQVDSCVIVPVPDPLFGQIVGAFIKLRKGASLDEKDLVEHCQKFLSDIKIPRKIQFLESFPLLRTQKVDIQKLISLMTHEADSKIVTQIHGAEEVEEAVLTTLGRILKIESKDIDLDRPLMELGLTSLKAVELSTQLGNRLLGHALSTTLVFNYPTAREVIRFLSGKTQENDPMPKALTKESFPPNEPIAIVGMSCRFPNGNNSIHELWQSLVNGINCIKDVPPDRFDMGKYYDSRPFTAGKSVTKRAGFIDEVDRFDASFFGMNSAQADTLEPAQRLLLELAWEALEEAGISPHALSGSLTGVFVGAGSGANEYQWLKMRKDLSDGTWTNGGGLGSAVPLIAGRISYFLNFKGPSVVIDTACSSSMVALHYACQSLRTQDCNVALAAGVNLILTPKAFINLSNLGALAADGQCKSFDGKADGYGRAEGGAVLVLKRLSDATANRDRILAIVRGTAINQDGRTSGITAPNGLAQKQVIQHALRNVGVNPLDISYVEAHGTGTALGDPIEMQALVSAYCERRSKDNILHVGSIKSNLGHMEAAAGLAGVIKTVLALGYQRIPPNLHFQSINPKIDARELPVQIPVELTNWTSRSETRLAGVSSFGMSGTNAHAIIEEWKSSANSGHHSPDRRGFLLFLSAKSDVALRELAQRYFSHLSANSNLEIGDFCFTANCGRAHFEKRVAILGESISQMTDRLSKYLNHRDDLDIFQGKSGVDRKSKKIAFLFSGTGNQYPHMGKQLYESEPIFRSALNTCAKIVDLHLDRSLIEILFSENSPELISKNLEYSQVASCAIEYSLAQLWISWGIVPNAVLGHSMGEFIAAAISGLLTLEDAFTLIVRRARLIGTKSIQGTMAAINLGVDMVEKSIAGFPTISIAAVNGRESVVVSGNTAEIIAIQQEMERQKVRVKILPTDIPWHSELLDPILDEYRAIIQNISAKKPTIAFYSTVTGGKVLDHSACDTSYWLNHTRRVVQFSKAITALCNDGIDFFIESGPGTTLVGMGRQEAKDFQETLWLPSIKKDRPEIEQFLATAGHLYANGLSVDWARIDVASRLKISLPTYPFQRKRHWLNFEPGSEESNLAVDMRKPKQDHSVVSPSVALRSESPERRKEIVSNFLLEEITQIVAMDSVPPTVLTDDLTSLGLDSLSALDLRRALLNKFSDIDLSLNLILKNPYLDKIAQIILAQVDMNGEVHDLMATGTSMQKPEGWIQCKRPHPSARVRLICFHYAGGAARVFDAWNMLLPDSIELHAIQLPGRWNRNEEPFCANIDDAAQKIAMALAGLDDKPYIFFGHSLGALLAFEVAKALRRIGSRSPQRLILSSVGAPHVLGSETHQNILKLSEFEFLDRIRKLQMIPDLSDKPELFEIAKNLLRADLALMGNYKYVADTPLDIPIVAIAAKQDGLVPVKNVSAWQLHTQSQFGLELVEGGHMALFNNHAETIKLIAPYLDESEALPGDFKAS